LAEDELNAYLAVMGIESLCIPLELGAPFLNVDWDSEKTPSTTGRMLSIGFEDLYPGAGWSDGYLLYATYNFATGSEYDTFATREDWEAVQNNLVPELIEVDGVKGFVRVKPATFCFQNCFVFKTFIFPFDTHYVAVVYNVGAYDADADLDRIIQRLEAGEIPTDRQAQVEAMDRLVTSIQFQVCSQRFSATETH
jgi:hypothetical protein